MTTYPNIKDLMNATENVRPVDTELAAEVATLRTENERLWAFVKRVATITDSGDYDFHDVPYDLVKSASELLASLAGKTEGERDGG